MEVARLADLDCVFLDFDAEYVEGCEIVYLNSLLAGSRSEGEILEAYSYLVKPIDRCRFDAPLLKTFKAERYGGDGILSNGGGGRCGFDGTWQLKGLGPNQLVGHDVDPGHGDGNLSLNTAVYESIWAEIIQAVLPYGATRTVAILDTGLLFEGGKGAERRGLLVREPVVRPAHFIRSVYFKQKRLDRLGEDAQRVKDAIHKLVDYLPRTGHPLTGESLQERLKWGLVDLAGRYGKQFSAARAKHIIHYNMSASNVSITGGWLDLSGVRLFTDFIKGDRVSVIRFKTEYMPALQSINSLCYYLEKYAVISAGESLSIWNSCVAHFNTIFARQLNLYQVAQAGFPLWLLNLVQASDEFAEFSSCLQSVLELDSFTLTATQAEVGWDGYAHWAARLYNELLAMQVKGKFETDLSWLKADKETTRSLLKSYGQLVNKVAEAAWEQRITRKNLYRCMVINATRLNRSHRLLHDMEHLIETIGSAPSHDRRAAYQRLSCDAVLAATFNLANEQSGTVPFWLSRDLTIGFEPISGMFILQGVEEYVLTIDEFRDHSKTQDAIHRAVSFYGTIWSDIDENAV